MKINHEEWNELHPNQPSPPKNKKCKVLILREGIFGEKSKENTYQFKADEKGVHKIVAWKEVNE